MMKQFLRTICIIAVAFTLSSCNLASKLKLHGIDSFSMPDTRTLVLGVDAENGLGVNVSAMSAVFELGDGEKVFATATLKEPVRLRRKSRETVSMAFDLEFNGLFAAISMLRKAMNSPENLYVSGEVVGKSMGIKKKKVLTKQPLSKIMSNFVDEK
ncbi:MAG: hypothetical protein IKB37_02335 [Rikenellaceae bacterium]|nr:hypothetical protein [Rikenellaceae bacterium]